ncbi:RagB/SusD family nutrient uptake outer membrane protein [Sphingobacterium arenae]|uniref:RagB/SusD family nutrient uptake outer membrane protein n=1 Tax=Sphingobacterium arenae TaxID=1280598 RepID=A0ABR7XZN5_9SPHI|nr:RagB/SusD family nutrient uptake outer membrane protein [Sphingobacterium arenae]MBD1424484.1 RagB/SusD family nutrient uptake outer membrane protein [Sphingobacterium arenae]
MKKIYKYSAIGVLSYAFILSTSSCSNFLSVEPTGSLTEEQVFEKIENVQPLVLGLYDSYRGCKEGRNGLMPYLGTDETQQGNYQLISSGDQAGMDKYNGQLNATSTQVASIWNNRWPAVVSAAKAIYALSITTEDPERAMKLTGEACFIRGLLMFELSMLWGEIPVVDMNRTDELGLGRQPLDVVWQYIIDDFTTAANNLPESYDGEPQRATKGAALAMLGKAYMAAPESTNLRDFSKADDCFKQIIDMGRYRLLDNYSDLFRYDNPNTTESLFELQFNNVYPDCNFWQFDTGSRAADSWFSQSCSFSGYDFLLPTPFAYQAVEEGGVWEDGDTRKGEALREDFTYYTNRYSSDGSFQHVTPDLSKTQWTGTTDELDPHIKKYEDPRTDILSGLGINNMWNSGKNFAVIRYADVLLLHAECLNELGQTAEAINIVNDEIRTRAWGGTLPEDKKWGALSPDDFRAKIMDERMRELCFEGWRRIDLLRTGQFVTLVKERNKWAKESGTIQDFHKRYPIPDTEIKTNDAFTEEDQNPGYN